MSRTPENIHQNIERQFICLASKLNNFFPELDIRFNLITGSNQARCIIPEISTIPLEIELDTENTEELFHETVFSIKMLGKLFDS